jgi:transposase
MGWTQGKAYTQDLRDRVFTLADAGYQVGEISEMLCVSASWISKVLSRRRTTGELSARAQCNHVPLKLCAVLEAIRAKMESCPDMTLAELNEWLLANHQLRASSGVVSRTLARLGLTRKKRPCTLRSRADQTLLKRVKTGETCSRL